MLRSHLEASDQGATLLILRPPKFYFDQLFRIATSSFLTKINLLQERGHFRNLRDIFNVNMVLESSWQMINIREKNFGRPSVCLSVRMSACPSGLGEKVIFSAPN